MGVPLVCGTEPIAYFEGTGLVRLLDMIDGTGGRTQAGNQWLAEIFRNRVHRDILGVQNVNTAQELTDANTARNANN